MRSISLNYIDILTQNAQKKNKILLLIEFKKYKTKSETKKKQKILKMIEFLVYMFESSS